MTNDVCSPCRETDWDAEHWRTFVTIVTSDSLLRGHRQLVARKGTYAKRRRRSGAVQKIRRLVVRMAEENPTLGYTQMAIPRLYLDPRGPQECRASRRAIDHRPHPQGAGPVPRQKCEASIGLWDLHDDSLAEHLVERERVATHQTRPPPGSARVRAQP